MADFFCMQCMRRRPQNETYCPMCGHKHDTRQDLPLVLLPAMILNGRYLIGNVQSQDQCCICYCARDLQCEEPVQIRELFPVGKTYREGETVIWSVPQAEARKWMEDYLAQNSGKELFLDNGTIYCVEKVMAQAAEVKTTQERTVVASVADNLVEIPDELLHISTSVIGADAAEQATLDSNGKGRKQKTAGKERKIPKIVIVLVCVLAIVLGWCGIQHLIGDKAMENQEYEKAISGYGMDFLFGSEKRDEAIRMAGEAAYSRKEFVSAAAYFERLGEAGADRWSDSIYALGEQLIAKGEYDAAIAEFERIASEERAEEQIGVAMLKKAEELYRSGKTDDAIALAKSIKNTNKADVVTFLNNVYISMADLAIVDGNYQGAMNIYRQCVDMPTADFHLSIMEQVKTGNPYKAATEVIAHLNDGSTTFSKSKWLAIFTGMLDLEDNTIEINDHLSKKAAIALLQQPIDFYSENQKKAISEKLKKRTDYSTIQFQDSSMIGQSHLDGDSYYQISSLEELYEECGTAPDGKILIIVQSVDYPNKEKKQSVSYGLMELLPAEYQPASLAEVEYVVLIKYDYGRTGTYVGGSAALRENARVFAYRVPGLKQVAASGTIYAEDSPNTVSYLGVMPAWFSGGMPNAAEKLVEVLKKIM